MTGGTYAMTAVLQNPMLDCNTVPTDPLIKGKEEETDVLYGTKSNILIKTASGELVEAGFKMMQCESGFRIVELDSDNYIVSKLQLKENDKLIAINNVAVSCWEHHVVEDFLKHMFDPERSHLTLIIERKEWTDAENYTVLTFEIVVDYFLSRGVGSAIALCTRTILSKSSGFTAVFCMQYKGKSIFRGFQKHHRENHSCFPCVLQWENTGEYVSVKNCSSVGLLTDPADPRKKTSVQKADSRFFFLKLKKVRENSEYVFESIILKDMFLTWNSDKRKMKMAYFKDSSVTHETSSSTFHIYSL